MPQCVDLALLSPHSSLLSPHSSLLSPHSSRLSPHSSLLAPKSSLLSPRSSRQGPSGRRDGACGSASRCTSSATATASRAARRRGGSPRGPPPPSACCCRSPRSRACASSQGDGAAEQANEARTRHISRDRAFRPVCFQINVHMAARATPRPIYTNFGEVNSTRHAYQRPVYNKNMNRKSKRFGG